MEQFEKMAVILSLLKNLRLRGSWCGETHIQKAAYFLQELLKAPLGFEFILYKHGPFAFDLRDELAEMPSLRIIRLQPQPYPYGPSFLPGDLDDFFNKNYSKIMDQYGNQIAFVAEQLKDLKVTELEKLATALFITLNHPEMDIRERARAVNERKPHISEQEAKTALSKAKAIIDQAQKMAA